MAANTDRLRGALLGLAIGDALGAPVEFASPGAFPAVMDFRAGGRHRLNPGEWTDDTAMALALADSMTQSGWDLNDQARRYVKWWQEGAYSVNGRCFDIGLTIRNSLARFESSGDARRSGNAAEDSCGNGSIMRLAPIAIRFAHLFPDQLGELTHYAAESSLPTHASATCQSACRYLAVLLCGLMHGLPREEVFAPTWGPLTWLQSQGLLHASLHEVTAGGFRLKEPPDIVGSGFVVKALEAALWAVHNAPDFATAVLRAVNLGNDADTTGAVCGQLAGAAFGQSGIPQHWRDALARRDLIDRALNGLLQNG